MPAGPGINRELGQYIRGSEGAYLAAMERSATRAMAG